MSNISYSAVVLDKQSRERLINRFKSVIPEDWSVIADHMTINLGEIDPEYKKYLGLAVRLTVNDIAMDDKVIAVGISLGINAHNPKAHITLAVNKANGGKPVMSNNLTNWEKLRRPLLLRGKITQIEFK